MRKWIAAIAAVGVVAGCGGSTVTRPTMAKPQAADWSHVEALCELIGVEAFSVMYAPRTVEAG